jgi:hypothetical protein
LRAMRREIETVEAREMNHEITETRDFEVPSRP